MLGLKVTLENRYPGLDLARSIAISLVVFSHSLWISNYYPSLISWLMRLSGTIGVEIFFVISGFLIGKIVLKLIQKEDYSLHDVFVFLKRRWFRTLPNYYLALLINLILWICIYKEIPEKLFLYFFYLQNITTTSPAFFRIAWSLAVEQFCYIVGPISLFFLIKCFPKQDKGKLFVIMSLLVILIFGLIRYYFNQTHVIHSLSDWNEKLRKVTIYRLDAIYYGFIAFYVVHNYAISDTLKRLCFNIGLTILLTLHIFIFALGINVEEFPFFFNVLFLPLNSIAICLLLPFLTTIQFRSMLFTKWITLISVISYSIYLLHYTIILHLIKEIFPSDTLAGFSLGLYTVTYWMITFVFSYLLYKYFESPMTRLREVKNN
ncbi:acyltransferase [Flavobacterium amnicola]|uniref:Acyltransferase n=1 Tax=Flavobacterium amnicola TaxID=2506422 RepID=A0A4Q1K4F2_9FLAO|nr:acyltransferase [Flavobacterium amnicola]RXR20432.1 acyltransferase [Flavobacterium amnicola]